MPIDADGQDEPARFTPAVLQAAEMLGLYHAELARVLKLLCGDVGRLANAQSLLQRGTPAWQQAERFLRLYRAIYRLCGGNRQAAWHWLRRDNRQLGGEPLLLMVDHDRLEQVLAHLESLPAQQQEDKAGG